MIRHGADGTGIVFLVVAAGMLAATPLLVANGGEAAREFMEGLFWPIGLLLLPVTLLILIQFLSTNQGAEFSRFLSGGPDTLYGDNGSSIGIVLVLLAVIVLLYKRAGGGGGDAED